MRNVLRISCTVLVSISGYLVDLLFLALYMMDGYFFLGGGGAGVEGVIRSERKKGRWVFERLGPPS